MHAGSVGLRDDVEVTAEGLKQWYDGKTELMVVMSQMWTVDYVSSGRMINVDKMCTFGNSTVHVCVYSSHQCEDFSQFLKFVPV